MATSKVPSSLMRWGRTVSAARSAAKTRGDSAIIPRIGIATRDPAPRERGPVRPRAAAAAAELHAGEELRLVLREIAEAMSARAVILTMHPGDDRPPSVLLADDASGFHQDAAEELLQSGLVSLDAGDVELAWSTWHGDRGRHDVLMMPVAVVDGHTPLLISAIFDRVDGERRSIVEEVYLRRRPFAIGYFRLWQLERLRRHRIAALQAAINLNEVGVMLLDRTGRIVFGNDAAMRIVDAGDGLACRASGLHATNLREDLRLQVALGHVIDASQPGCQSGGERRAPIMSISRAKGPPLILSVLPTSEPADEPSDVAAILYVLDPVLDTNKYLEPLCKLFQLTPVETKLVCQLAGGATLAQAAETMHVKELTARSCLKQVFLKTGTNRQADLVRVMFSNLARTTRNIPIEVI